MTEPWPSARATGVVYLLYFPTAMLASLLMRGIITPGDAAATASAMLAHESAYRAGIALDLIGYALYIATTVLFYRLFAPVNRTLSLLAGCFSFTGCTILIFATVFRVAPLVLLRSGPPELQAAGGVLLSLKLYGEAYMIAFVFFGLFEIVLGFLIYRAAFLPRILGAVMIPAGVGWLMFLYPPLGTRLFAVIVPLGALAEVALALWLVIKGVDVTSWRALAGATQNSG